MEITDLDNLAYQISGAGVSCANDCLLISSQNKTSI